VKQTSTVWRPKAAVITVNYKSVHSTVEFLHSLERAETFSELKVIIVDNSPEEKQPSGIRVAVKNYTNAELIESPTNLGYFGAARFALDKHLKQENLPDWVIVSNHDIQIEDPEFFEKLLAMDPTSVGVIAPSIQAIPSRVEQNPFMRRRPGRLHWSKFQLVASSYAMAMAWDWLWRQKAKFKAWTAHRTTNLPQSDKRRAVYAPHGSFLIFSRRYFEAGGFS
jgi:hypothetical protein